jgi:hypothetical protein
MQKRAFWLSASLLVSFVVVTGCDPIDPNKDKGDGGAASDASAEASADANADAGATSSISCYIASQFICDDYPSPTAAQLADVPVACSSASGDLETPSKCPQTDFKGKCTRPEGPTVPGPYVERFYTGADVAYAQDFCVNTANGVWSTTF